MHLGKFSFGEDAWIAIIERDGEMGIFYFPDNNESLKLLDDGKLVMRKFILFLLFCKLSAFIFKLVICM